MSDKVSPLVLEALDEVAAFSQGHFVYKSGLHGDKYIDKERLGKLGGIKMHRILTEVAKNAVYNNGLDFEAKTNILVVCPAYGAIHYSMPICLYLEEFFQRKNVIFRPGRTQILEKQDGSKEHYFPEKLIDIYAESDEFVVVEDIVNMGSTIREVNALTLKTFGKPVTRAFSIVSRGGQTAKSMGLKEYHPLLDVLLPQYDPRTHEGLAMVNKLGMINTKLGKGKGWVEMFGQPLYAKGKDFSAYPFTVPVQS